MNYYHYYLLILFKRVDIIYIIPTHPYRRIFCSSHLKICFIGTKLSKGFCVEIGNLAFIIICLLSLCTLFLSQFLFTVSFFSLSVSFHSQFLVTLSLSHTYTLSLSLSLTQLRILITTNINLIRSANRQHIVES